MILETIDQKLKQAMKDHNQMVADTLRMLKTRIKNEEISKQKTLSDEEIMPLVSSEIKRRKDSVELYTQGGRPELAEKEQSEISVLQEFLPEQLSEEQVSGIIDQVLAESGPFSASDFGKAMGAVMPKLKGKTDGTLISKILKEKLK